MIRSSRCFDGTGVTGVEHSFGDDPLSFLFLGDFFVTFDGSFSSENGIKVRPGFFDLCAALKKRI